MTLPENFDEWEHLQSTLMRVHNRLVREEFSDTGGDDWNPEITTSRGSLRVASTLKDSDTATMTLIRLMFYYVVLKKAKDLQVPIYGLPIETYHDSVKFKPQVTLLFYETPDDAQENNRVPLRAHVSFRLIGETATTMTQTEVDRLADKIYREFATGAPFKFKKGPIKVSYYDFEKGYRLILAVYSESEARDAITAVLRVNDDTLNWDYLTNSESGKNYLAYAGTQVILGKSYKKPQQRPVGWVHFRRAELKLHGLTEDVLLVAHADYLDKRAIKVF